MISSPRINRRKKIEVVVQVDPSLAVRDGMGRVYLVLDYLSRPSPVLSQRVGEYSEVQLKNKSCFQKLLGAGPILAVTVMTPGQVCDHILCTTTCSFGWFCLWRAGTRQGSSISAEAITGIFGSR